MRFERIRYSCKEGDIIPSQIRAKDGDIELSISHFISGAVSVSARRYGTNYTSIRVQLCNPIRTDLRRAIAYVMSAIKEPFVQGEK